MMTVLAFGRRDDSRIALLNRIRNLHARFVNRPLLALPQTALHNPNFLFRQAIQFVHQMINLPIYRVNLTVRFGRN